MTLDECDVHFKAITDSDSKDEIKSHLRALLNDAYVLSFEASQGEHYWRGIHAESVPYPSVSRIIYAPPEKAGLNRMSDAGSPMVYCARTANTVLSELRVKPGDYVQWFCFTRVPGKYLRLGVMGELDHVARTGRLRWHGHDPQNTIRKLINAKGNDDGNRVVYIDAFLASILAQSKSASKNYLTTRILAELAFEQSESHGLMYPSVEDTLGVNMALIPSIFDSHTRIICCQHVRIEEVHPGNRFDYTLLQIATGIDSSRNFNWRPPNLSNELCIFNLTAQESELLAKRKDGVSPFSLLNPEVDCLQPAESEQSQCASSYRVRNAPTIVKLDEQLDKPYEEWAQHPVDPWIPWKRKLSMAALGTGTGLLMGAVVHVIVVVMRPDLPAEISWSSLGYFCCGGALCALIESRKG